MATQLVFDDRIALLIGRQALQLETQTLQIENLTQTLEQMKAAAAAKNQEKDDGKSELPGSGVPAA